MVRLTDARLDFRCSAHINNFHHFKMAASMCSDVDLGFVEENDNWRLLSHFFPSKIGGKPSWLSLQPILSSEDVKCLKCSKPCSFLAQVYSPNSGRSFHRTLFIFICKEPKCCQRNQNLNVRVFRSQLSRKNDFYSEIPPEEKKFSWAIPFPSAWKYQNLCVVCGCSGPKTCAKCKSVHYCSRDHQIVDWKTGHKEQCKATQKAGKHQRYCAMTEYCNCLQLQYNPFEGISKRVRTHEETFFAWQSTRIQGFSIGLLSVSEGVIASCSVHVQTSSLKWTNYES